MQSKMQLHEIAWIAVRMGNIQGYVEELDMGQMSNLSLVWKKRTFSK